MADETPEERKARLKSLRAAKELSDTRDQTEERPLKFRNYLPKDEELQQDKVEAAKPADFIEPTVEPTAGLDETAGVEETLINVAPKKANFDLRRDVAKKLEKLEKRTQKAMVALMKEEEERRAQEGEAE